MQWSSADKLLKTVRPRAIPKGNQLTHSGIIERRGGKEKTSTLVGQNAGVSSKKRIKKNKKRKGRRGVTFSRGKNDESLSCTQKKEGKKSERNH